MNKPRRNRFHSICPYFAMFPEQFAEYWIERLSAKNDIVFDPFSGRGTAPFQAVLMDRRAIGLDVNPVAYCVTQAKVSSPRLASLRGRITQLERAYSHKAWGKRASEASVFFRAAFAPSTLGQLLFLRERLNWEESRVDAMIGALTLGCLHGESSRSSRYLSAQMPRTISTKPRYSVRFWAEHGFTPPERDVFALLRKEAAFRYGSDRPAGSGVVFRADMRDAPKLLRKLGQRPSLVVTSPPYLDTTSFEEDQWLRLWLLGGPDEPRRGILSPDDRHRTPESYWRFIGDFWRMIGRVVAPGANVVVRLGGRSAPEHLIANLATTSVFAQRPVSLIESGVSEIKGRQTDAFRPGTSGTRREVDCWFKVE
jgi:hypothetical protein